MPSAPRTQRWLSAVLLAALVGTAAFLLSAPPDAAHAEGKERVDVPKALIRYDDGDTITIAWPKKDPENVRILGIDTPEVLHLEHNLPYPQPFGYEAAGFLRGCVAASDKVELLRSGNKDRYGRTLAYILVDGKNYSPLVIAARLSYGPSARFGDNDLPEENAACIAAAKDAGPPPFEKPYIYRRRMRAVAEYMKKAGTYPTCPPPEEKDAKK